MRRGRTVEIKTSSATAWTGSMTTLRFESQPANCSTLLWSQLLLCSNILIVHPLDSSQWRIQGGGQWVGRPPLPTGIIIFSVSCHFPHKTRKVHYVHSR